VVLVRSASTRDLEAVFAVSRLLDTMNLPHDGAALAALCERAAASFAGELPVPERVFLFVLEDDDGRIVGTSLIHAQHGTRKSPHVFFDVRDEERYSESIDRHLSHRVLRIGYDHDGPTEIGGLVLAPDRRGAPEQLGRVLSYARFLFIAARRTAFRDAILAELMPPLEEGGASRLWECLGRVFTGGMSYQEADRLSTRNKEFIRTLFPRDPIYASLLPVDVQAQIGQVGPATKGVERMLRRIGFAYAGRIDPFDGGPHFVGATDALSLVRDTRPLRVARRTPVDGRGSPAIVGVVRDGAPWFSACRSVCAVEGGEVAIPDAVRARLDVATGDAVWVQPMEGPRA
jgi:arginine N-succinyltransferase